MGCSSIRLIMLVAAVFFQFIFLFAAKADQLRILTSLPPSFYDPFLQEFAHQAPNIEIVILNKNTNAAVDELLRGNDRNFDIFWSSSPEAFAILRKHDLVARSADNGRLLLSPFAYSAVGWTKREDDPQTTTAPWESLLSEDSAYQIAFARPSRSGSAHIVLERFLQVQGWQEGWAYILEFGAKLYSVTARSFSVLEGVSNQRFKIGVAIDFLAHSRAQEDLSFTYGSPVMVTSAKIALLKGGNASISAQRFMDFVISDTGQRLLLRPDIARTPYSAKIRSESSAPQTKILENALSLPWLQYNEALASERYWAVNTLFDVFVFEVFERRQAAWKRMERLEQTFREQVEKTEVARIRGLLTHMPVGENEVGLEGVPTSQSAFAAFSNEQKGSLARWRTLAEKGLRDAECAMDRLEKIESPCS